MNKGVRVAVVGATGVYGETLMRVLEARDTPVSDFHAVASDRSVGRSLEFRGDDYPVQALESFDFSQVDVALFALPPDLASDYASVAAEAGAVIIDSSSAFSLDPDVPLVMADVNEAALDDFRLRNIVRSPSGAVLSLITVLREVERSAGLSAVVVAGYHAVVGAGRAALDELAAQCGLLLNAKPVPAPGPVFASRIAFNSIALAGASLADGRSEQELAVENDVRALLGRPDLTLAYTAVWVPVFYGDGLAVNFTTVDGIETQALETVLAQTAAVAPAHTAAVPTPAAEGADQDFVHWGRLRATGQTGQEHALWLVADHVRSSAVNSVKLVEILVRDHF